MVVIYIMITVYLITVLIDIFITLRNKWDITILIVRCVLYPFFILGITCFVIMQMDKPHIFKKGELYGIKSCFMELVPPNYISIRKEKKVTSYYYESNCDSCYTGYWSVKSNVYYLRDKDNKISVWGGGKIITGDSLTFTKKDMIIGNEHLPIDMVIVHKGCKRDTLTFYGSHNLPTKIDSTYFCNMPTFGAENP